MTARDAFDGGRQRVVLSKLQRRAGLSATEVARDVDLSYPQYLRYVWGKLPIRSDQVERFAAAYGVTPLDLAAELSGVDVYPPEPSEPQPEPQPVWTFRTALRGHITESLINELAEEWEGRPLLNQQAAVDAIKQMAGRIRAASAARPA